MLHRLSASSRQMLARLGVRFQLVATAQRLYLTDPVTPGLVFFLPHGTRLVNQLVTFMKHQQQRHGFEEVITPLIYRKSLWETLGHWENYHLDMFRVEGEDQEKEVYGLKPMNCPGHCVMFKRIDRLVHELPVRFSDFLLLHRNEASGALSGLTRVRRFHQDDGHIFCTQAQMELELHNTLRLVETVYRVFGLDKYRLQLLTRPEKAIGTDEQWAAAEQALTLVLERLGKPWLEKPGDGAFYGPKIDISVTDAAGKEHQVATIQLDFQLPQRFELEYQLENNTLERPVMIHRAVFGLLERFLAILIDHYGGKWPFWLSPRQCLVVPLTSAHEEYARQVAAQLRGSVVSGPLDEAAPLTAHSFHVDVDERAESVGYRIKEAYKKAYNYIAVVGDQEMRDGTVTLRTRGSKAKEVVPVDQVLRLFHHAEALYALETPVAALVP